MEWLECPRDKEHSKYANDYYGMRKNAKITKRQREAFDQHEMPTCFDCESSLVIRDGIVQ